MCSMSSSVGSSAQWTSSMTSSNGKRADARAMNELDRIEEVATLLLGWQVERLPDVGEPPPQLGHHARDLGCVVAEVFADDFRRHDRERLFQHLDERRVRDGPFRLVAPAEDRERTALLRFPDELAHESGLADAGLAADEHEPAVALERSDEFRAQGRHLGFPADEHVAWYLRRLAHPHDFPEPPRLGEALELMLAGVAEGGVGHRARELSGDVGYEDLAARRRPRTRGRPRARPHPRAVRPATPPRRCSIRCAHAALDRRG